MNKKIDNSNGSLVKNIDFKHYSRLFWEKKLWIILITLLGSIAWLFVYPSIIYEAELMTFSSVVRFDDPRASSTATGIGRGFGDIEGESRIRIIETTNFLKSIVDSLKLNIRSKTLGVGRDRIFKRIELGENIGYGNYRLKKEKNLLKFYYSNSGAGMDNKLIEQIEFDGKAIIPVTINNIYLEVNTDIFDNRDEIFFKCYPDKNVLQSLKSKLDLKMNRRQTLLRIQYQDTDPLLGCEITNLITEKFLKKSLAIKQAKTRSALKAVEEQLIISKRELSEAEESLRRFRERNPQIFLAGNTVQFNQDLASNELKLQTISNEIKQINNLIEEKDSKTDSRDKNIVYQEILAYLVGKNVPGIVALNDQYQSEALSLDNLMTQGYSQENYKIKEINSNLESLRKKIDQRVKDYLDEKNNEYLRINELIDNSESRLKSVPLKELQLAKLQREVNAKESVYTNVLLRYNEIKVAVASITPDVFLLEEAVVPIIYKGFSEKIKKYMVMVFGPFLSFFFAIGLLVLQDLVWRKARSEKDMEKILKLPVLTNIPVIDSIEKIPSEIDAKKKVDSKLITMDYSPSIEAETFRNLRTRLILNKPQNVKQRYILTSLMPDDGKSLVSSNLAVTFAQLKQPTLLIDADMRRGVLTWKVLII